MTFINKCEFCPAEQQTLSNAELYSVEASVGFQSAGVSLSNGLMIQLLQHEAAETLRLDQTHLSLKVKYCSATS